MPVMWDPCPHGRKYRARGRKRMPNVVPRVLLLAATLLISKAGVAAFTPIKPPVCPSWQEIPFTYRVGGTTGAWELPDDSFNCTPTPTSPCPHYINYLDHYRFIATNNWTNRFAFR